MRVSLRFNARKDLVLNIPYTHMSEQDEDLFYDTMAELLTYANQVLGIVDVPEVSLRGDDDRLLGYGTLVSEAVWQQRWIIDDFAEKNPLGVPREHLEIARLWRHAVHDIFTCIAAGEDAAVFMNATRAFAVGAMRGDADQHVHAIPSLMMLTLLPFKGGILTDSKTLHLSDRPYGDMVTVIVQQAHDAVKAGVLTTADQLIAYELTHRGENQISERSQRTIDEYLATLMPGAQGPGEPPQRRSTE